MTYIAILVIVGCVIYHVVRDSKMKQFLVSMPRKITSSNTIEELDKLQAEVKNKVHS